MQATNCCRHSTITAVLASSAMLACLPDGSHANPIDVSDSINVGGNTFSGRLIGDYAGDASSGTLTLSEVEPFSSFGAQLESPILVPLDNLPAGDPCLDYNCSAIASFGSTLTIDLLPWNFNVNGSAEFDAGVGSASLTATPQAPADAVTFFALDMVPTFTVTASQEYGIAKQLLANAEAFVTESLLNTGNYRVSVSGSAAWSSISLGAVDASANPVGGGLELDFIFEDLQFGGELSYQRDISFDSRLLDAVSNVFINTFPDFVDSKVTQRLVAGFDDISFDSLGGLSYDCTAVKSGATSANIGCGVSGALTFPVSVAPAAGVASPTAVSLLGAGLLLLLSVRKERC